MTDAGGGRSVSSPRPGLSLRAQLTFWFLAVSLVINVTLIAVVSVYLRLSDSGTVEGRLRSFSDAAAVLVQDTPRDVTDDELAAFRDGSRVFSSEVPRALAVFDSSGRVIASTLRPPPPPPGEGVGAGRVSDATVQGLRDWRGDEDSLVSVIRTNNAQGASRTVWAAVNDPRGTPDFPPRVLAALLAAEVVSIGIAGWMIAGIAVRPIAHLHRLTASLAPEAIEQEIAITGRSSEVLALERDLHETRLKLRSALHAQERFVSNVSHELKTPIAILLTEAQTLPPESVSGEGRKFVTSVVEEMRRLGRVMESFLLLTRVKGGASIPHPRLYEINEFVLEAIGDCQHTARGAGVEIAATFPESAVPASVAGEPELLRVMMHNIIRHAVRFSPHGSTVEIRVLAEGSVGRVIVHDFGGSMSDQNLERAFDRTSEAPSAEIGAETPTGMNGNSAVRGRGIGLAIAQGIAELHGGSITLVNARRGGCEFCVQLPIVRPMAPIERARAETTP